MFSQQLPLRKHWVPHPEWPCGLQARGRQESRVPNCQSHSAARKDLLHGLGELLPLVSRKQERASEHGKALPSLLPGSAFWVYMGIGKL